jgi:hypothetical protein
VFETLLRSIFAEYPAVPTQDGTLADVAPASQALPQPAKRELPDVTGFFVVVLVALGLFIVPVGATIMQGPAIVASLFSRH